jgi:hypothetical protein
MFNALYNSLLEWNRTSDDRQKLQHLYLVIVVVSVIVAGIVSLVDNIAGQDLLIIPLVAGAIFLINAVLWSLLESTVVARLSGRRKR